MDRSYIIYAAYGSNMGIQRMAHRCPGAKFIGVGVIENYKLTFRGIRTGLANIQPCAGASVPVVLWSITRKGERLLDHHEGFPDLFQKKVVKVKLRNQYVVAMTYIMAHGFCDVPLKPSPYYIEMIQRGYENHGIIKDGIFDAVQEVHKELAIRKMINGNIMDKPPLT
ncbi:gamma-glutamylcyclotransferase family protein [Aminipila terrae]|uniref:Gamma-glutamylcyclotransferase n=1 Tax=Aminipila terrae TaxID=2697030 RepID=A0A6P1MKF4_9FIRM|nr:gamma-glutamylcyclotransferase family protein [Aminipila terrae]QHI72518.1 gamma-glutamylcyclotransferase [Aminipila terrae]